MHHPSSTTTSDPKDSTFGQLSSNSATPENPVRAQLAFRLDLQSMPVLLTVLANVARLGCDLHHLSASDAQARVTVLVPVRLAHRVESCLAQIVGVLSVSLIPGSDQ